MNEQMEGDHVLKDRLVAAIRTTGPLSFNSFMAAALYDPDKGYYSAEKHQPGRKGDFFTSVSVGSVFGELLAIHIANTWEQRGRPSEFEILEQGANNGQLALDYLKALARSNAAVFTACQIRLVEQSSSLQAEQRRLLKSYQDRVSHHTSLGELTSNTHTPRLFLANELLDAFPIHLVQWTNHQWSELLVDVNVEGEFIFRSESISEGTRLLSELADVDANEFEDGYTTEVNLAALDWIHDLRKILRPKDRVLLIDYGFTAEEFFAPHRKRGTIRCYDGHRCHENVLNAPGLQDITAHVNFTRIVEEAASVGLSLVQWTDQHHFLTKLASPLLLQRERDFAGSPPPEFRQWVRQFQQLTHPGLMGRSFQVLEWIVSE